MPVMPVMSERIVPVLKTPAALPGTSCNDALALARTLADRLVGPAKAALPDDYRLRLARAHALALVDLLDEVVLSTSD